MMDDDIETAIGCGAYQVINYVIVQLAVFVSCANTAFMAFGKVMPTRWTCDNGQKNYSTSMDETNSTFSADVGQLCSLFANESCQHFYWDTDFYSLVPQWQLICDRTAIVYWIASIQMMGEVFGSALCGQLADAFGRKWTVFFSLLTLVSLDALSTFSPNWQLYLAFRFFIGVACGGTGSVSFVLLTESLPAKHRLWVTSIAGWHAGFTVFAGLAYATRHWKTLSLATAAVGVLPLIMLPFIPENPRWLLQKNRYNAATNSMNRVMKWNRSKEPAQTHFAEVVRRVAEKEDHNTDKKRKYTFWHLCATRKMATTTAVLIFVCLSISMVVYGTILNNDKLSGNIFLNFFLFTSTRWVSSVLAPIFDAGIPCCGRKVMSTVSCAAVGLVSAATTIIMLIDIDQQFRGHMIVGLVLLTTVCVSPIWAAINLTQVEAYPTAVRSMSVGVTAIFTRLGGVIVPFVLQMGSLFQAETWAPSPYAVFAVMASLSAILCGVFLPETKGKPLPEEMLETESWWNQCCCFGSRTSEERTERKTCSQGAPKVAEYVAAPEQG